MMKNKKILIALIALIAVVALMVGIYFITRPKTEDGTKNITITVVHSDGTEKVFTCKTNEEYLGPVLVQEKIVEDNQDSMGLYFQVADGESVEGKQDHWWKVCVGDKMSDYGADRTPITDGGTYKLVYTIGYEGLF